MEKETWRTGAISDTIIVVEEVGADKDAFDYYGGMLVAESAPARYRSLIAAAPETARKLAEAEARIAELEIAAKGAFSALSQKAPFPADVTAAKKWLSKVVQLTEFEHE